MIFAAFVDSLQMVRWITARAFCFIVTTLALMFPSGGATYAADLVLPLKPSAEVDEPLFLVSKWQELYRNLPQDVRNAERLTASLARSRHDAIRFEQYIQQRHLDADLVPLFDDLVKTVDLQVDYLVAIGCIDADAIRNLKTAKMTGGFNIGFAAGGALGEALESGAGYYAVLPGLVAGGMQWLHESDKWNRLEQSRRDSITTIALKTTNESSQLAAHSEVIIRRLADKYMWKPGENGLDEPSEEQKRLESLIHAGDFRGIARIFEQLAKRRPRDAYTLATLALLRARLARVEPADLLRAARDCQDVALLVPAGSFYDSDRGELLFTAACIATQAAQMENGDDGFIGARKTKVTDFAVKAHDVALYYLPQDPSGEIRESKAWALARNGQLQAAVELVLDIRELRIASPVFTYNAACLAGALGNTDQAFTLFRHAVVDLGFDNISMAKTAADLARMRDLKKSEFNQLIQPRAK